MTVISSYLIFVFSFTHQRRITSYLSIEKLFFGILEMAAYSSRSVLHDGPPADETMPKWKRLIHLLSFKFPYIISHPDVEEIRVLLADLGPLANIENPKFRGKYEESKFLFDDSLIAFKSNIRQIDFIQSLEDERRDKQKQAHHARKVLKGRCRIFEQAKKEHSELTRERERLETKLNILVIQIETESETTGPPLKKQRISKRLVNLDHEIEVHQGLVAYVCQLLEEQQSVFDELNEESESRLYEEIKKHDTIRNRCTEEIKRLEERLSGFVVALRQHVNLM